MRAFRGLLRFAGRIRRCFLIAACRGRCAVRNPGAVRLSRLTRATCPGRFPRAVHTSRLDRLRFSPIVRQTAVAVLDRADLAGVTV